MSMIQAFVFDMDGVILDSMPYHLQAWEQYLASLGLDAADLNRKMHGKHNNELLQDLLGPNADPATIARMSDEKEALYRKLIKPYLKNTLIPGLLPLLERFPKMPKAVASNANKANVEFVLEEADLRRHFRFALNGEDVERGKPDPEIYEKAAKLLNVEPYNCIVFEDSQTGIDAALAAGMNVVAMNTHRATLKGAMREADNFLDRHLQAWLEEHISG